MGKKYGTPIKKLVKEGDRVAINALEHRVGTLEETLGEASHNDIDYGQADPRLEAARKTLGDRTAEGGNGPDRKG
jgi:hypothetical protein